MSWLLVTNDDGVESPALVPLVNALSDLMEVRVVVPEGQRSWISKAITRYEDLIVHRVIRDGIEMHAVSGFPADCVQLGLWSLWDEPPTMVVSGMNVGSNAGLAFILGSGTVGAAVEASIGGIPGVAFSVAASGDYQTWAGYAWSPESVPMWERTAAVCADITADLLAEFPQEADVVSVNLPEDATLTTERRVTHLADTSYRALFQPYGERYVHEFRDGLRLLESGVEGSDVGSIHDGVVAITPVQTMRTAPVDDGFTTRLERRP